MEVEVRNGNIEQAIKVFNLRVHKDGILKLAKWRHDGFLKPSVRKKFKHFRALLRIKRMEMKREQYEKVI